MDLRTGKSRPITEANSKRADSFHNWCRNSHWFVFTSRRLDGLYSNLYLASIDKNGRVSKPFLLPQRDPVTYYKETIYSFNVPDFTSTKVKLNSRASGREILSDKRTSIHVKM